MATSIVRISRLAELCPTRTPSRLNGAVHEITSVAAVGVGPSHRRSLGRSATKVVSARVIQCGEGPAKRGVAPGAVSQAPIDLGMRPEGYGDDLTYRGISVDGERTSSAVDGMRPVMLGMDPRLSNLFGNGCRNELSGSGKHCSRPRRSMRRPGPELLRCLSFLAKPTLRADAGPVPSE